VSEGVLAEALRHIEKDVLGLVIAAFGGSEEDTEILLYGALTYIISPIFGPKRLIEGAGTLLGCRAVLLRHT
jgi:hypothetical protein